MKKLTTVIVVLAVLALHSMALAGERAGAFSVSPFVGGYMFDEDAEDNQAGLRKNEPMLGLRLGYDWTDSFATEAVFEWMEAEYKPTPRHQPAWAYRLDLLYNFMPQSAMVPYVAVGGGVLQVRYRDVGRTATDGTANFGGGVKFFMTDNVALRADVRHVLVFTDSHFDRNIAQNWDYSLGVSFLFGGRRAAVAEYAPVEPAAEPVPATEAPLEPIPAAEPTPGHYKYCITLQGEFDIDQAIIRPEFREEIAQVGEFMKKYPTTTAVMEGHTDNVGTYNHNMQLSQRRAEAVVNHLVERYGIDRARLSAKGYGFTRPIADNSTDDGKQRNRRIEAIIDCAFDVQQIQPPERLCMSLVIDFDSNKAEVKPEHRGEIAKVADYMKQYPTTTAVIEGHTDNVGDPESNLKLSQQRAENVVNYMVKNLGIDRTRLSAKGYGNTRRISYNDTPEGRQKNRRINAVIDCVVRK